MGPAPPIPSGIGPGNLWSDGLGSGPRVRDRGPWWIAPRNPQGDTGRLAPDLLPEDWSGVPSHPASGRESLDQGQDRTRGESSPPGHGRKEKDSAQPDGRGKLRKISAYQIH